MWNPRPFNCCFAIALVLCGSGCNVEPRGDTRRITYAHAADGDEIRARIDRARSRVWTLTPEGVGLHDTRTRRYVAIALPSWQWVGAPHACPPDLAIGPDGEVLVTSNIIPALWRIDPDSLSVTVHPLALDADADKDVGFSSLAYAPERRVFLASSAVHGSLWEIDAGLRRAAKLRESPSLRNGCELDSRGARGTVLP